LEILVWVEDIGNFLNNTGLPTSNILGRVTGGHISNIDGIIQTTGSVMPICFW
jgi:filamentous hemagglutinin family protein